MWRFGLLPVGGSPVRPFVGDEIPSYIIFQGKTPALQNLVILKMADNPIDTFFNRHGRGI